MKLVKHLAGVAVLALVVGSPTAAAVSKAVGSALQQAQRSSGAAALAAINTAKAAAKTPEERTKVSQMAAYVYARPASTPRRRRKPKPAAAPAPRNSPASTTTPATIRRPWRWRRRPAAPIWTS